MAVGEINVSVLSGILKDDAGIKCNTREKGMFLSCVFAIVGVQTGLAESALAFYDIMIPIDGIHTAGGIEAGKQRKGIGMDFSDFLKAAVFPQFVPVAQLQIGKAPAIIVLQGSQIKIFIFQEIVIDITDAPVTVAKQNVFGTGLQRQPQRMVEGFGNAAVTAAGWG